MAIQWKRNTRYPSVTRPGVFPRIQEFDAEGNDILEDTWFELTGIDEEEMNKFKFALGTWVHISRRNRKVIVLDANEANTVTYPITSDDEASTTEPKPTDVPEGFLGGQTPYQWAYYKTQENGVLKTTNDNPPTINGADYSVIKKNGKTRRRGIFDAPVNLKGHEDIKWDGLGVEEGNFLTNNNRFRGTGPGPLHVVVGDRTPDRLWVCRKRDSSGTVNITYQYFFKPNIIDDLWNEDTKKGVKSPGFQWEWQPSNKRITDPVTNLKAYGDWVEAGSLVITENQAGSDNQYVGLVTKSPIENVSDIEQDDLFLYHEIGSEEYNDISAPLEVYFSFHFLERDPDTTRSTDIIKYQIIEWGDEDERMSDQQILDSEFFYLYESDDSIFDGTKYKKLCLIASEAETLEDETVNEGTEEISRGTIHNHVYTEPGIKTIKTIVFRFAENGEDLLETSIVHTNIFIADPNQTIQDFNIFGGEDFTVLPLEDELEPIIGNVDKRSEYVRSIEKIKNNDLYQSTDYLEKLYADDFLPKVKNDLYGEYAGNIDLGITRVFKKTYNIFDFIGGDALQIINNNFEYPQDSLPLNSSATEILIDDGDCVVELNPSNQNNDQVENTGVSDEKGLLMGDFRLVKNPKQKIRKEDAIQTPKLNTQKKRQAF